MVKVFIDGKEGTTGLRIAERFAQRDDIELITLPDELRKDTQARKDAINSSDFTFLCLPDAAAIEAVSLVENENVRIIDASTAHRTDPGWDYGFPELSPEMRKAIAVSKRVAVPGCYASGFISLVRPLVEKGVIPADYPIVCHAVSGYSGGGKKLIAKYEDADRSEEYSSTRMYSLGKTHKHIKEMKAVSGLEFPPVFCPSVGDFYNGMTVTIPITLRLLGNGADARTMWQALSDNYRSEHFVKVMPFGGEGLPEESELFSNTLADTNMMQIFVYGNEDHALLVSRLDNLGKGASGAAVQCMNIMMGIDEGTGLE